MSLRVLYAAYRNDPRDIDTASSMEYGFYTAMLRAGMQVNVIGPYTHLNPVLTRLVRRAYKKLTKKGYTLFPPLVMYRISKLLAEAEEVFSPDVIFAVMPSPLPFYSSTTPIVWRTDTTYEMYYRHYFGYSFSSRGGLAQQIDKYMQALSIRKATRIVTASDFCKRSLVADYHVPVHKINVLINPSAIPEDCVPQRIDVRRDKTLEGQLRLLFVGRQGFLKGLDTAVRVVQLLNEQGLSTTLTVCSEQSRQHYPNVRFVGTFKKSDPGELEQYAQLYRVAHLLIHPARYESAGIVPSEAAAFATPTVTNDVGGLSSTVAHGVSGIVLRAGSPAEDYASVIYDLVRDADRYYALCETTRQRYEQELNWTVAGERFVKILEEIASGN